MAEAFTDSGTDIKADAARAGGAPGLPGRPRAAGAQPGRGLRGHLPGARRAGAGAHRRPVLRPARASGCRGPRCSTSGRGPTGCRSATRRGPRPPGCSTRSGCTGTSRPAGGRPRTSTYRTPGAAWLPAAEPSGSTSTSTTCAASLLGKPADARTLAAVAGVTGYPGEHGDHRATTQVVGWMHVRADGRPARLPRPHEAMRTPMTDDPTPELLPRVRARPPGCPAAASSPAWRASGAAAVATTHVRRRLPADRLRRRPRRQRARGALAARRHRRPRHGRAARRPGVLRGPARRSPCPKAQPARDRTRCSGCTRRWRRCSGCGTPASSPRCTPSGCRSRTARTSRPWRRSRTPTPARRCAAAGSTG